MQGLSNGVLLEVPIRETELRGSWRISDVTRRKPGAKRAVYISFEKGMDCWQDVLDSARMPDSFAG